MGTTDSSALFLSAVKKSNVTRVEEDFSGVADAQQRHGWGGRIGGDMENTCMQWRVRGWLVACGGESQVKVTEKEEPTDPANFSDEKKIEKCASQVPGRIDPRPQPRRL